MTPELEAIGLMTDMLSLMYRYSVDTLGSIISPITIYILFLFKEEFEINKLYASLSAPLHMATDAHDIRCTCAFTYACT